MQKKRRNGRVSAKTSVEDEIAHLRGLDLKGLRARWQSIFQRSAPAHLTRHLLFAIIAYQLQADRSGDLDHETICNPFETHGNIDPITKNIVLLDNNITNVNADAEFDPLVLRDVDILFSHAALNFVGTPHGVDHAGELSNSAVPSILDDTSAMLSDFGIEKRSSKRFQSRQRAFFVDPYQAARARDIRRQNSCQPPLYVLAAQDAPPSSGKFNGYIAELWTDVRLCPCPVRVLCDQIGLCGPCPVYPR
jgi:hypothetical protein